MTTMYLPPYQIFGSHDSVDLDIVFFVDELGTIQDSLRLSKAYATQFIRQHEISKCVNPNLAVISQGLVKDVYKGTADELNNALFNTYSLHDQYHPAFITATLPRDKILKLLRTIRKVLSFFTRTAYRKDIKHALRTGFDHQVAFMNQIDITTIELPHTDAQDIWKVIAFSVAQTMALYEGYELYTKAEITEYFPEVKAFINRELIMDFKAFRELQRRLLDISLGQSNTGIAQFEYRYESPLREKTSRTVRNKNV